MSHPNPNYVAATRYFGDEARNYDESRSEKPRWEAEQRIVTDYVRQLPSGSTVLDVPFGTGRFAATYLAAGLRVTGVDISKDMLEEAKRNLEGNISNFELRVAPAEKLPFADGSFDYLICNRFIKWLPSERDILSVAAEFRRVCRKEMFIQVTRKGTTPNEMIHRLLVAVGLVQQRKITRRSMRQLETYFSNAHWKITKIIAAPDVGRGVAYLVVTRTAN